MAIVTDLEELKKFELEKRIKSGEKAKFKITIQENDHPFFSHFKVKNESNLTYNVDIHSLKNDGTNFCSCPDYKYNGLGICKHISGVLSYLKEQSPQAFDWTYQKQPEQTNVLLGRWENGIPQLRISLSEISESLLSYKKLFFDDNDILIDKNKIFSKDWELFITRLGMAKVKISYSAHYIINMWKHEHNLDELISSELEKDYPPDLLLRPMKAHQIKISSEMIAKKHSLTFQSHGTGKRVAALGSALRIRSVLSSAKILIVTHPYYVLHWRKLIKIFSPVKTEILDKTSVVSMKKGDSKRIYILGYENLVRDAQQIERIAPDILIMDALEQVSNWKGKTGKLLKTAYADFVFALTSVEPERNPQLLVNMAQYLVPEQFGPMWKFLAQNTERNKWGKITGYKNIASLKELIKDKFIHIDSSDMAASFPLKPKQNVAFEMNQKQRKIINEALTELAALVNTKYSWSSREMFRVTEQIRNLRIGLGDLSHLTKQNDVTPKQTYLESLLKEYKPEDNRILIFTHWSELIEPVRKVIEKTGFKAVVIEKSVDESDFPKGSVGIMSDSYLDASIPPPDTVIHYDLPWNKELLLKRRELVFTQKGKRIMEFSFVVTSSIEERSILVLNTLPRIIGEWFESGMTEDALPEPNTLKSLVRKLVGKRDERINSSQHYQRVSKVSVRDRKVVSRRGVQEIEAPLKRRPMKERSVSTALGGLFKPSAEKTDVVWHSMIPVPDIKNDIVFLDIKTLTDETGELVPIFASITSLGDKVIYGWEKSDFSVLETILENNELIIGNSIHQDLNKIAEKSFSNYHNIKFFDFMKLVEQIVDETDAFIDFGNIIESTLGRKIPWDESELRRLSLAQRKNDLLALSKSDISVLWEILSYVIREGYFFYKLPVGRQKYSMQLESLLPPQLVSLLKARHKL